MVCASAQLLAAYIEAAPTCAGLPWQLLAGIGKVESDHGRVGGATLDATGRVTPHILGPRLDGTANSRTATDTDQGLVDHDPAYDRAVGPMQFLPATWEAVGIDGNADGVADINNIHDAIATAARYLCPDGSLKDPRSALLRYNPSGF